MLDDVERILQLSPEEKLNELKAVDKFLKAAQRVRTLIRSKKAADRPQDRQDIIVREMLRRKSD